MVVDVGSADIIATIISLKEEVEAKTGTPFTLTIAGATESHLVADELARANIGVIVTPTRSFVRRYSISTLASLLMSLILILALHLGRETNVSGRKSY